MKPVFQTTYGKEEGNCFPACIASVLEMDLKDVPHFCKVYKSYWQEELNKWLLQFGLGALTVAFQEMDSPIQKGWCFAAGPCGPDGVMHSVVMKDMKMVHNPHKGWGELDRIVDYTFFVVLDPVKYLKKEGESDAQG